MVTYEQAHTDFQRRFLSDALTEAKGNMCAAARVIEVHRNTVLRMVQLLGIRPADFRPERLASKSPRKKGVASAVSVASGTCPACGSKRHRRSQMKSREVGVCLVRCQDCYRLFPAAESEAV